MKTINGVVPVMLTPFTADDQIDYPALVKLIDWYLAKGVDALLPSANPAKCNISAYRSVSSWRVSWCNAWRGAFQSLLRAISAMIWRRKRGVAGNGADRH